MLLTKIFKSFKKHDLFLCTAESCTGGLLGHMITNFPGASAFYLGGQVTYSNDAKQKWLGVKADTLQKYGAVSKDTVLEMADGIRGAFTPAIPREKLVGISISGIAGPSGGSAEKPVGTVWIGLSIGSLEQAHCFFFKGDREEIKAQAAERSLVMLVEALS